MELVRLVEGEINYPTLEKHLKKELDSLGCLQPLASIFHWDIFLDC